MRCLNCFFFVLRTANLLSKFLKLNNGTLDEVNEELFFLFVRNNVHGDSLIFGSAIALERGVYRYSIPSCADPESFVGGGGGGGGFHLNVDIAIFKI